MHLSRQCGRYLSYESADANTTTVCCKLIFFCVIKHEHMFAENNIFILAKAKPFRVAFHTDSYETCTIIGANKANVCEGAVLPAGIIGFKLMYWQASC